MAEIRAGKIGGLLLAAGGSSRLGQPKQLVEFRGKTLLRRAAETLLDSGCDRVLVILGAELDRSLREVDDLALTVCTNPQWRTGISSSITVGLKSMLELEPKLGAVVITLCDQLYISTRDIDQLISKFRQTQSNIVAAAYKDTTGVPALFSSEVFDAVLNLQGDKGARHLLRDRENVAAVNMPHAAFDVDTPDDILAILKSSDLSFN